MDLRKDLRVNLEVDLWLNPQVEKQRYEETDQIFVQSSRTYVQKPNTETEINDQEPIRPPRLGCVGFDSIRVLRRNRSV